MVKAVVSGIATDCSGIFLSLGSYMNEKNCQICCKNALLLQKKFCLQMIYSNAFLGSQNILETVHGVPRNGFLVFLWGLSRGGVR